MQRFFEYIFPKNLVRNLDYFINVFGIRIIKVKQKVSGQFKTGQQAFCKIRSVINTLIKRNLDVVFFLNKIMSLEREYYNFFNDFF